MTAKRSLIFALALLPAVAVGVTGMAPKHAAAQGMPGGPPAGQAYRPPHSSHIEGHIAFLKTELKITPAQEALFAKVADAMREDVKEFGQARQQAVANFHMPPTAVQILEMRANLATLRAKTEDRFLAAFRPLYQSLSADQKQVADEMMARRDRR